MEDKVGSLEVGKLADMAVPSGNPLKTAPGQLSRISVIEIYRSGRRFSFSWLGAMKWESFHMQNEIKTRDKLLDDKGFLKHRGFSKYPVLEYNPENIKILPFAFLNRLRLKEWDYYGITTKDYYFSVTLSNIGYAGVVFAYLVDFSSKTMIDETILTLFGKGCKMPRTSESGDIVFRRGKVSISFSRLPDKRIINVNWPGFGGEEDMAANLILHQPPEIESIIVSTPIRKKTFYYNQKINCMPTEGNMRFGSKGYTLSQKNALATLDWGRGVWEYSTFWNWASASGFLDNGTRIGLNLGKGFGDLSRATENCFFLDGKMTKLDWVEIDYNPADYMKSWFFKSSDARLELEFKPFFDRVSKTNMVLIRTEVHQLFGEYSGKLVTDTGKRIDVKGLIGWAEEHKARW